MVSAECFFLDVGQASAHVIDLGDGRAILVDCGRTPHVVLELLRDYLGITRIAALLLTHNHIDHAGGMPTILAQYRRQIEFVGLLQDQPADELTLKMAFRALAEEVDNGFVPHPTRLERSDIAHIVYPSHGNASPNELSVEVMFPRFRQNIDSQTNPDQNASSAVLRLQCGARKIVFPGDAGLTVWKTIHGERNRPIACDVLAVPHHGGQVVRQQRADESDDDFYNAIRREYDWLYTDCICPKYAIISAGTGNTHNHPIPVHLDALRDAGAKVLCTQITERCHSNVTNLAPAVLQPQSLPGHAKGRNPGVACAGTILVQVGPDEVSVDRFEQHRQAVQHNIPSPRCNT